MNTQHQQLLEKAYGAFNSRDIESVLTVLDSDVEWPNGWEGGYVQGHEEVRKYWTRQWKELDPEVQPVGFVERADGQMDVQVHQKVRQKDGTILFEGMVHHVYTFKNGKVTRMEIQ